MVPNRVSPASVSELLSRKIVAPRRITGVRQWKRNGGTQTKKNPSTKRQKVQSTKAWKTKEKWLTCSRVLGPFETITLPARAAFEYGGYGVCRGGLFHALFRETQSSGNSSFFLIAATHFFPRRVCLTAPQRQGAMSADRGGSNGEVPVVLLPPAGRFNRSGKLIGCSGVYQNTPRVSKVRSISDPIRFNSSLRCGGTAVWGGESVLSPSSMFPPTTSYTFASDQQWV